MIERAIFLFTVAGGAALGIFWPLHKAETPAAASSALEVTLERSSDRHFYADAGVNGNSIRFLIDTGASEIALSEEDARKAGITVDPAKYELIGQGASGMVRGQYVKLAKLEVGAIHETDVEAVVVQGANVSLLGQPFLEDIDEIVIRKDEMVLRDQQDS
ncbi:MAG: TIGR02281 family clan AA aspartic protease [Sphingomonas sp.]|nr:TIGR02281 family clan AA aspartic protease [Sphingomonas sp.]